MTAPLQHRRNVRQRRGFTLLELILAVGLTSLLMAAIYGAMSAYWNLAMDSHEEVEQTRVAHMLLKRLARDIQSCTFAEQTDQSADDGTSGSASGSGGSAGGSGTSGFDPGLLEGLTSGSGSGLDTGSATGQGTGNAAGTTEATTNPWKNGLIGTSQDLILYTSSPDRDLNYATAPVAVGTTSRNSDLMIVRWLLAESGGGTLAGAVFDEHAADSDGSVAGLARGAGGVTGFGQAIDTGNLALQVESTELLASEVRKILFTYFDGVDWATEWNSAELNRMPQAIRIELTLVTDSSTENRGTEEEVETLYWMVVPVPVSEPYVEETAL